MKRRIVLIGLVLVSSNLFSQEPADALRYSWLTPSGTARSQAIGGALVGLGGDFTSTFVNPAGIALYKTHELVLTPGFSFETNKGTYLNTTEKAKKSNFNYGATGLIFATPGSRNGSWRNFSFSFGLNRVADFNSKASYTGLNNQSSYSEKYLEELINDNVTDPNAAALNYPYGSSLAFNTFLIDTIDAGNGTIGGYRSQATPQTGVTQHQDIETKGGITDFSFAGSANLRDKLYLGGSISIHLLKYERTSRFTESDVTTNTANNFNFFNTDETLETNGAGINVKLGLIYKPVEYFRLGFAFHSPTVYNLTDKYTAAVTTDLEGYGGQPQVKTQSSRDFNDGAPGEFSYNLVNPYRFMIGAAYVFREESDITKQRAFISADVEYVNYQASSFESSESGDGSNYFDQLNNAVDELYKGTFNARIGGELKFHTFMIRGGFAYFGNPYEQSDIKADRMNISGGLGYRDRGMFIDLTYVHQLGKDVFYPYRLNQGFFAPVNLKNGTGNVLLTVGFKF
jgi:long-subunit fatty acid transport protein